MTIHYNYLDMVGPHGVQYIRDIESIIEPSGAKTRQGVFLCPYCKQQFKARMKDIRSGKIRSCGCYKRKNTSKIFKENLLGQKFGHLTVIGQAPNKKKRTCWKCQCDCGNIKNINSNMLKSNRTTTCGDKNCPYFHDLKAKTKDITNQRFGKLVALYPAAQNLKNRNILWYCKCDCENYYLVSTTDLINGNTKSCGCLRSYYEDQIAKILKEELNIYIIREKTFDDCVNPFTNRKLRFDFYLPKYNTCIEFNGKQHYEFGKGNYSYSKEKLKDQQNRDNIKKQYCFNNNINYIVIPYWDINKINATFLSLLINQQGE